MNTEADWKKALKASPDDATLLLAYGDWLEEQGEQLRACQARQQAGAGKLIFSLWHPSWGDERVGEWDRLAYLKSHVRGKGDQYARKWGDQPVPVEELVLIIEWRATPVEIGRRPFTADMKV
jgi:uncharacterized protein (TIGR02996 family)